MYAEVLGETVIYQLQLQTIWENKQEIIKHWTLTFFISGTSVRESFLTACHGRISVSDLNLSVPQKRLQLEECAMCKSW